MSGWHRGLRLVPLLVARTQGTWPYRAINAAGLREALTPYPKVGCRRSPSRLFSLLASGKGYSMNPEARRASNQKNGIITTSGRPEMAAIQSRLVAFLATVAVLIATSSGALAQKTYDI